MNIDGESALAALGFARVLVVRCISLGTGVFFNASAMAERRARPVVSR